MRIERVAEEKAKKKVAVKRQEEEQKKRLEEEARLKKIQQTVRYSLFLIRLNGVAVFKVTLLLHCSTFINHICSIVGCLMEPEAVFTCIVSVCAVVEL